MLTGAQHHLTEVETKDVILHPIIAVLLNEMEHLRKFHGIGTIINHHVPTNAHHDAHGCRLRVGSHDLMNHLVEGHAL